MFKEIKTAHNALLEAMAGEDEQAIATAQANFDTAIETASNEHAQAVQEASEQGSEKITELEADNEKLKNDLDEKITSSVGEIKDLNTKIDEQSDQITQLTENRDQLSEEKTGLESQVETLTSERDELKTANEKLAEKTGDEHIETVSKVTDDDVIPAPQTADEIYAKAMKKAQAKANQN